MIIQIAFLVIVLAAILSLLLWIKKLIKKVKDSEEKFSKLLSQKKSGEVILGQISEQLAPFLDSFPYDPHKVKFIGMPIDYICFDENKITFIEVKSGKSTLSPKQNNIKKLIKDKQVFWDEYRVPDKVKNEIKTTP